MERWIEVRTALQVAKLGTVSAAASALGIHRITVNRHIDALEKELGTKLFQRHGRGYVLTEQGHDFLAVATRANELLIDFVGRTHARNAHLSGELILSTSPDLSHLFMRPIIRFRAQHPDVRVVILSQDDLLRLEYGEAHIALHVNTFKPDNPDYVVNLLKNAPLSLFAHESYIERMGMPKKIDDFRHHDFIRSQARYSKTEFQNWLDEVVPAERFVVEASHPRISTEAITSGIAIGFLADYLAKNHGQIQRVEAVKRSWSIPVWLVTHVDLHHTGKVQSMLKAIRQEYTDFE